MNLNKAIEEGDLSFLASDANHYEKCCFLVELFPVLPKKFVLKYLQKHPELRIDFWMQISGDYE